MIKEPKDQAAKDACEIYCFDAEAVAQAKERMLEQTEIARMAETFKIVGDPTRIKILHALSQRELCVCDLAEVLQMTSSAVSHQLRVLRNARLVKYQKTGKMVYYSMEDSHITALFREALQHVRHY